MFLRQLRPKAELLIAWPVSGIMRPCKSCQPCAEKTYNELKEKYSGTEAYLCFTMLPLDTLEAKAFEEECEAFLKDSA